MRALHATLFGAVTLDRFAAIPDVVLGPLAGRSEAEWHRSPSGCGSTSATAPATPSRSARGSRHDPEEGQAHGARTESQGAREAAAQDAGAQGAPVREAVPPEGEASAPVFGRRVTAIRCWARRRTW